MSKGISEFRIFITGFVVGLPPHVLDPHYALSEVAHYIILRDSIVRFDTPVLTINNINLNHDYHKTRVYGMTRSRTSNSNSST